MAWEYLHPCSVCIKSPALSRKKSSSPKVLGSSFSPGSQRRAGLQVLFETREGIISMHEKNGHLMGIVASERSPKKSSKKKSDSFFPHWDTNFEGFVPAPARLHVQYACKYSLDLLIFHLCFGRCCVTEKGVMLRVFWQVSVGQLSCSSACAAGDSVRFQPLLPVTQDYLPDTLESCHL